MTNSKYLWPARQFAALADHLGCDIEDLAELDLVKWHEAFVGVDGHECPPIASIAWLETMLAEIDAGTFGRIGEDEDPDATSEMIQRVRDITVGIRQALAQLPQRKTEGS